MRSTSYRGGKAGGSQLETPMPLSTSMCLSVALYRLAARTFSIGALTRLERWQTKCMRRKAKSVRFDETNDASRMVRFRAKGHSIESRLRRQRLGLPQRILNGGRNIAVARASIFDAFPWGDGGRATPWLVLDKQGLR